MIYNQIVTRTAFAILAMFIVIKMIGVRIGLDSNMRPEIPCHVYDAYFFSSYKELQNYSILELLATKLKEGRVFSSYIC